MLKLLRLSTALAVALVPFLPEAAFSLPSVAQVNNSQTVILDPVNNSGRVIGYPVNRFPTGVSYPVNNYGRVTGYPVNRFPSGASYPINNFGTVIINPNNVNPTPQQSSCGSMIIGSSIPSPVPVDAYTGRFCR